MRLYLLRRVIELLPVLFLASIVVFLLLHLAPGDPSYFVAGRDATPEVLEAVRQRMGLDKPLHVQYLIWLRDIVQGNLGESALSDQPVSKLIWARLPATLHLTVAGFVLTILLSLLAGIPGALRPNSKTGSLLVRLQRGRLRHSRLLAGDPFHLALLSPSALVAPLRLRQSPGRSRCVACDSC